MLVGGLVKQTLISVPVSESRWSTPEAACIKERNNKDVPKTSTLESCLQLCEEETSFACASVDFWQTKDICFLSADNSITAWADFSKPCPTSGVIYSEWIEDIPAGKLI